MKYICDIYNFWSRKYILASFKYMSSIFQIYVRYILVNIYIKYMWNYILNIQLLEKIYFICFDIYLTYIFFPFFLCGISKANTTIWLLQNINSFYYSFILLKCCFNRILGFHHLKKFERFIVVMAIHFSECKVEH